MTDKTLFKKIKHGDRELFDELVRKYYGALNYFAWNLTGDKQAAEDVVQDVFTSLWINRSKVSFDTSLKNFLYVSTRNMALNYLRSASRKEDRAKMIGYDAGDDPAAYMAEAEASRRLSEAIDRLPERTGQVIRLSLRGMKQEEIAEAMDIAVTSVKTLKASGVEKLRKELKNEY